MLIAAYQPPQPDVYFCDNITKTLDKYTQSYHKVLLAGDFNAQVLLAGDFNAQVLLAGDFNAQVNEAYINNVMSNHDRHSIVKEPPCFKNLHNPACLDLFLTNFSSRFQITKTIST